MSHTTVLAAPELPEDIRSELVANLAKIDVLTAQLRAWDGSKKRAHANRFLLDFLGNTSDEVQARCLLRRSRHEVQRLEGKLRKIADAYESLSGERRVLPSAASRHREAQVYLRRPSR